MAIQALKGDCKYGRGFGVLLAKDRSALSDHNLNVSKILFLLFLNKALLYKARYDMLGEPRSFARSRPSEGVLGSRYEQTGE